MKAEINDKGSMIITAESKLESYALGKWYLDNVNDTVFSAISFKTPDFDEKSADQ